MLEIIRYSPQHKDEWNAFVAQSKNGTFLFDRGYMDYHADCFADCSLMAYRDGRLYALLPANVADGTLFSHRGLTYGGLVTGNDATAAATVELLRELNAWLRAEGIGRVVYKAVPWIYHRIPAEEDLYAIFRECNARLTAREISSAIMMEHRLKWSTLRRRCANKAGRNGVEVQRSDDLPAFWHVLDDNLTNKYGVHPVHTLDEMELLKSRFPDNIILYTARKDGVTLAGTVLYITHQTVHAQYISASPEGKQLGALDAIYDRILNHDLTDCRYFDFGKSTEDQGHYLNESLIYQKEGFGARGVCYDTYEWKP